MPALPKTASRGRAVQSSVRLVTKPMHDVPPHKQFDSVVLIGMTGYLEWGWWRSRHLCGFLQGPVAVLTLWASQGHYALAAKHPGHWALGGGGREGLQGMAYRLIEKTWSHLCNFRKPSTGCSIEQPVLAPASPLLSHLFSATSNASRNIPFC